MPNLQKFNAKVCLTAAGVLIHENKILFIKHKKLGIWFAPGGHIDENELPHRAAEREFLEETGIKVEAYSPKQVSQVSQDLSLQEQPFQSKHSEYLPSPIETNLHWVSKENYQDRVKSSNPDKRYPSELWPRGCEQHLGFVYLVRPVGSLDYKINKREIDDIGWFSLKELDEIETNDDIRYEAKRAFSLSP